MEIKVNCHRQNEGTFLFEGTEIRHKFVGYESIEDFHKQFINYAQNKSSYALGIPNDYYSKKPEKDTSGGFLLITFINHKDDFNVLVIKDSTVFITNKGQTIDKIMVA